MSAGEPRIAVVHEWLLDFAGSERVLKEILELYPQADLFALVDLPDEELKAAIPRRAKATTFLQSFPRVRRWLRYYVPLMPLAIEQLDLSAYDIVISSSHAVAKGVITGPRQLHLSYVYTPMRYAWDLQHEYLRAAGLERGPLSWLARSRFTACGCGTCAPPTASTCSSPTPRTSLGASARPTDARPRCCIRRSTFPPSRCGDAREDFYLTVSRLEAYKRVDLLVEAFSRMPERRLVVIGDGPEMRRVRAAAPANVTVLGRLPTAAVLDHMRRARAFLFAGIEDFGIVMVEAQACGAPVIAFGRGGAAEIVQRDSGVLFTEQTSDAVIEAVRRFEQDAGRFTPAGCRQNAMRFDRAHFRSRFAELVRSHWERFSRAAAWQERQET